MVKYRMGIDVGGTNTDAVVIDDNEQVIAETKKPTTEDVSDGIYGAMREVLQKANVHRSHVRYAMLGTTHCTNAIVERQRLNDIGIIRIGAPAAMAVKPLIGVPDDLRQALGGNVHIIEGGHEFDGREITDFDEDKLYEIAHTLKGNVDAIAITSVFSPVVEIHEQRAAEILTEVLDDEVSLSLSSDIGSVGLLERENATILNAAVVNVAKSTADGFVKALNQEGIDADVFFCQNDGTLMGVDYAIRYPIYTVACGPTNSLRGASYLSDRSNALVVDVGGTTTDIGVLVDGFPRESSLAVEVGGARTNFRMPDLMSIGIGGGTIIHINNDGSYMIGPESVGYRIQEQALVFGGTTLTATDVAVAVESASVGDATNVQHLDQALMSAIYQTMVEHVESAIDQMKTSAQPMPVILAGGGSVLFPDQLQGADEVNRPAHHDVANAMGSAIAQVSGEVERIFAIDEWGREQSLEKAKQMAMNEAVQAGAAADTCKIVDIEDIPLAYLPGNATRIRAKAAGQLKVN